jgi:hypothetical protein
MSARGNLPAIQQVATEVTFDVLLAAAEAVAWAVAAAYPEHALADPRVGVDPPRDPVEAAQRVVLLADRIRDAVHRYRFLVELGIPVPEPEQESLPF